LPNATTGNRRRQARANFSAALEEAMDCMGRAGAEALIVSDADMVARVQAVLDTIIQMEADGIGQGGGGGAGGGE
jgi:hypothetical protein